MQCARIVPVVALLFVFAVSGTSAALTAEPASPKPTIAEVKKETQDFLRVMQSYRVAQRDAALARSRAVLGDLDRHIEELEVAIDAHWGSMSQAARVEARASLRVLRRQRNEVAEAYGRLQASSEAAWEEVKRGFSAAYEDLHQAWERAEREFAAQK